MLDPDTYVKEGLKAVDQLVDRGDLVTALKACEELLRVNPYHNGAQSMLSNIHVRIEKQNEEMVDRDIQSTMKLWDEHRYDDLRVIYGKLLKFSPNHKKLLSLVSKLNETVTDEVKKAHRELKEKARTAIESLITEQKFDDVLQACSELGEYFPGDGEAEKMIKKFRYAVIDGKLEQNKLLTNTSDFMAAEAFYSSLLQIEPTHKRVQDLLSETREHGTKARMLDAKIHLAESIERMKKMWNTHEYEKVSQACDEILQQDSSNFTAKLYKNKAASILSKESDELEQKQLSEHWAKLSEEYKQDKSKFVKI